VLAGPNRYRPVPAAPGAGQASGAAGRWRGCGAPGGRQLHRRPSIGWATGSGLPASSTPGPPGRARNAPPSSSGGPVRRRRARPNGAGRLHRCGRPGRRTVLAARSWRSWPTNAPLRSWSLTAWPGVRLVEGGQHLPPQARHRLSPERGRKGAQVVRHRLTLGALTSSAQSLREFTQLGATGCSRSSPGPSKPQRRYSGALRSDGHTIRVSKR
jgi:hypothetical protein